MSTEIGICMNDPNATIQRSFRTILFGFPFSNFYRVSNDNMLFSELHDSLCLMYAPRVQNMPTKYNVHKICKKITIKKISNSWNI